MKAHFEELAPNLFVLRAPFSTIWSAVYFVRGAENVLVDSCVDDGAVDDCIIPALAEIGVRPEDVSYLINTHAHKDHAGGNGRFVARSGCALAAYETCEDKLRNPLKYNRATRTVYPEYSPRPATYIPENIPDLIVRDGDMLGDRLRVYHAPGHDTECIMLHDLETNTLLTGDSLQGFGTLGVDGAGVAFYKDLHGYLSTIRRARELDPENIIAGHDFSPMGFFAKGREEVRVFLDLCEEATVLYDCLVRRQLNSGVTDVAAIARYILQSVGAEEPPYLFMTMYTTDEHIREMKARNAEGI